MKIKGFSEIKFQECKQIVKSQIVELQEDSTLTELCLNAYLKRQLILEIRKLLKKDGWTSDFQEKASSN